MKIFRKKVVKRLCLEEEFKITKFIHDLPTWMFPYPSEIGICRVCPICGSEMRLQVGRDRYIEKCSVIQVNGFITFPIHRACYNMLEEIEH